MRLPCKIHRQAGRPCALPELQRARPPPGAGVYAALGWSPRAKLQGVTCAFPSGVEPRSNSSMHSSTVADSTSPMSLQTKNEIQPPL
jgi:hypothetical protein